MVADGAGAGRSRKRPLTYDVVDYWKSIQGTRLSDDGQWLAYATTAQSDDGELVVRNLRSGQEFKHARGTVAGLHARRQVRGLHDRAAEGGGGKRGRGEPGERGNAGRRNAARPGQGAADAAAPRASRAPAWAS